MEEGERVGGVQRSNGRRRKPWRQHKRERYEKQIQSFRSAGTTQCAGACHVTSSFPYRSGVCNVLAGEVALGHRVFVFTQVAAAPGTIVRTTGGTFLNGRVLNLPSRNDRLFVHGATTIVDWQLSCICCIYISPASRRFKLEFVSWSTLSKKTERAKFHTRNLPDEEAPGVSKQTSKNIVHTRITVCQHRLTIYLMNMLLS